MKDSNIAPERITKPIQLLGAWLVGLLAVDGVFLAAATRIDVNSWQSSALTIAAIVNVPVFIGALFLLQTKFRPELQEDSYYSTYLNNRTNEVMKVSKVEVMHDQLLDRMRRLEEVRVSQSHEPESSEDRTVSDSHLSRLSYGVNVNLDEETESKVENKLEDLGINMLRIFGHGAGKPDNLVVALADNLSSEVRDKVLVLARELGFEYYSNIEPFEGVEEDVLLGAYGKPEGKIPLRSPKSS